MVNPQPTDTFFPCPFDVEISCSHNNCENCGIKERERAKENKKIADGMRSFWIHHADGAERSC